MNRKTRLNKAMIANLELPEKGFTDILDTETSYLRLRVTAVGAKTFYLVKKIEGKTVWVNLGRFPEVNVTQARELCKKENAKLVNQGPEAKPNKLTFDNLFNRYMEGHAKPHKKTWINDQKNHDRYLKPLDKIPVNDITRETISKLHTGIGKKNGKYVANRSLALLKTVFNYGRRSLGIKIDNPAGGVKMYREQSRERFLDKSELQRFFQAVADAATPQVWQDFFLLCLWTGARRGNVQAMKWDNIDLENGIWRISGEEFKNQDNFQVVLIEPALEILIRRKFENDGKSKFVFPSKSKTGHVMEPKKVWWDILKRAGLKDVRLHDLRRTLGSWQAATGASLQVIGKTLGHRNQSTTAIYARLNLDPVRESLTTAAAAMREAMNGDEK